MREHLYTVVTCTDGVTMDVGPCLLLAANCVMCYQLGTFDL